MTSNVARPPIVGASVNPKCFTNWVSDQGAVTTCSEVEVPYVILFEPNCPIRAQISRRTKLRFSKSSRLGYGKLFTVKVNVLVVESCKSSARYASYE